MHSIKGSSSSKELFKLILRFKKFEVGCAMKFHFVHIAGNRMILQGVDGLSWGNLTEGVMGGKSMLSFIALRLQLIHEESMLLAWIKLDGRIGQHWRYYPQKTGSCGAMILQDIVPTHMEWII